MNLGAKGIALIKSFEKLELSSYLDQGGIPTIGWGHTGWYARNIPVQLGQHCTPEQAQAWFDLDTNLRAVQPVNRYVKVPLNQNQFDALCSFTYNVGAGALLHSTLLHFINQKMYDWAAEQFDLWDHVDGEVSAGLKARRAAEKTLYLSKDGI